MATRPDPQSTPDAPQRSRRPRRVRRRRDGIIALLAFLLAVAAAIIVVVHNSGGSNNSAQGSGSATRAVLDHPDLAIAFIAGATSDIAAVTSYDYRSLDSALSAGESVTTGGYRVAFRKAITGSVGARAKSEHRVQTFDLSTAAIGRMDSDGTSAKVLMFGTQTVADDATKQRQRSSIVTLTATVEHHGHRYLISDLVNNADAGVPPGSPALGDAVRAGATEVANLLSFRRAHFSADVERALRAASDPLRSQVSAQANGTLRALRHGSYDLSGKVTALGVVHASGSTVQLLVAATGTREPDHGSPTAVTDGRYQVTVVRKDGNWLTSAVDPVTVG